MVTHLIWYYVDVFQDCEHELCTGSVNTQTVPQCDHSLYGSRPSRGHRRLQNEPSSSSGVSSQHDDVGCSLFTDLSTCPFSEYFFHTAPLVVHPIIILRLLCHKMFGNMLRRKTNYSSHNLQPPEVLEKEVCPPRPTNLVNTDDPDIHRDASATSATRKRRANLHVQISTPGQLYSSDEELRLSRRRTKRAGSIDKHMMRLSSAKRQVASATMTNALKAIGASMMTPLDLNISPPANIPDDWGKKKHSFHFPSLKKRSRSQGYIAGLRGGSMESFTTSDRDSDMNVTNDKDEMLELTRELINLPMFEVDTHRIDHILTPLLSRCSSVPELDLSTGTLNGQTTEQAVHAYQDLGSSSNCLLAHHQDMTHDYDASRRDVTATPHNIQPISRDVTATPHNIQPISRDVTATPHNIQPISRDVTATPHNIQPISRDVTATPHNIQPISRDVTATPHNIQPISRDVTATPHNIQPISRDVTATPHNIQPISRDVTATPHNNQPISRDVTATPHNNQPISRNVTATPHNNQPISRDVTATPHNNQPISRDVTATPHNIQPIGGCEQDRSDPGARIIHLENTVSSSDTDLHPTRASPPKSRTVKRRRKRTRPEVRSSSCEENAVLTESLVEQPLHGSYSSHSALNTGPHSSHNALNTGPPSSHGALNTGPPSSHDALNLGHHEQFVLKSAQTKEQSSEKLSFLPDGSVFKVAPHDVLVMEAGKDTTRCLVPQQVESVDSICHHSEVSSVNSLLPNRPRGRLSRTPAQDIISNEALHSDMRPDCHIDATITTIMPRRPGSDVSTHVSGRPLKDLCQLGPRFEPCESHKLTKSSSSGTSSGGRSYSTIPMLHQAGLFLQQTGRALSTDDDRKSIISSSTAPTYTISVTSAADESDYPCDYSLGSPTSGSIYWGNGSSLCQSQQLLSPRCGSPFCSPMSDVTKDAIIFKFAAATPCESPSSMSNNDLNGLMPTTRTEQSCVGLRNVCDRLTDYYNEPSPPSARSSRNNLSTPTFIHSPDNLTYSSNVSIPSTIIPVTPIQRRRPMDLLSVTPHGELSNESSHSNLLLSPNTGSPSLTPTSPNFSLLLPSPGLEIPIDHQSIMKVGPLVTMVTRILWRQVP